MAQAQRQQQVAADHAAHLLHLEANMVNQHEKAARRAGWFNWFGIWLHSRPWESFDLHRPTHWIGTARELCLSQGILTGEPA